MQRRKVKCQVTKESGYNDAFHKGEDGKYYKNESTYNEHIRQKKIYSLLVKTLLDIYGHKNEEQFPSVLFKEIKALHQNYGYDVILKTFSNNRKNIEWSVTHKDFKTEFHKVRYTMAIIKNNINDVAKEFKFAEKRKVDIDNKEVEAETFNSDIKPNKSKVRDISRFLD